jgi:hypothetical protein
VGSLLSAGINRCTEARPGFDCAILDGDHTSDPRLFFVVFAHDYTTMGCHVTHTQLKPPSKIYVHRALSITAFEFLCVPIIYIVGCCLRFGNAGRLSF